MDRQRISSGSPYEASVGCSRAIRVDDRIVVSGTAPIWPDGSCDPDVGAQARQCLDIILRALAEGGARPEDVIRTRIYLVDAADADVVSRIHGEAFGEIRPATTMVVVAAFVDQRWRLEMEAEAIRGSA
jgi:enamine deaminase RidA (YjgF/YER057c/UK114 family)